MNSDEVDQYLATHRRPVLVVAAIVVVVAISGYFMGLRQTRNFSDQNRDQREFESSEPAPVPAGDIPEAVSYEALASANLQPNAGWKNVLTNLPIAPEKPESAGEISDAEREAVLAVRQSRRAYDGAPPVIPHPINQASIATCTLCHGDESPQPLIAGKAPPRMGHPFLASCTQCHVPSTGHGSGITHSKLGPPNMGTDFAGLASSGPGSRTYKKAPPSIPHPTLMRQNCASCHDPGRVNAIRTDHPQRENCRQCHAPSADFDQRGFELGSIRKPIKFPVDLNPPPETTKPAPPEDPEPTDGPASPESSPSNSDPDDLSPPPSKLPDSTDQP